MLCLPLLFAFLASSVQAWGVEGHQIIAAISLPRLSDFAATQIKGLIGDWDYTRASTWADAVSRNDAYIWTKQLHYVDALDFPGAQCSYEDSRDCPDGRCVVGALTFFSKEVSCLLKDEKFMKRRSFLRNLAGNDNEDSIQLTAQSKRQRIVSMDEAFSSLPVTAARFDNLEDKTPTDESKIKPSAEKIANFDSIDTETSNTEKTNASRKTKQSNVFVETEFTIRRDAFKFILHFAGDIAQPLHVCNRERGGNNVQVAFGNRKVKLHSVWDTHIIRKRMAEFGGAEGYLAFLDSKLNDGVYKYQSINWISSQKSFMDTNSNGNSPLFVEWATESDRINCDTVWSAFDEDPKQDFAEKYYRDAVPFVDLQIVKAGVRLANLFNEIFDTCQVGVSV